mgnify:CR=1 FL=1
MPANLTDANAFTSPVQVPAGSDPRALTYLLTAFQALANRTHYLNERVATMADRSFVVSPFSGVWEEGWTPAESSLLGTMNNAEWRMALDFLPTGSILKRVQVLVTPGANTMDLVLSRRTLAFGTPGAGSDVPVFTATSSGTSIQVMDADLTPFPETIDRTSGKHYSLQIRANSGAGASNDTLWGVLITASLAGNGAY